MPGVMEYKNGDMVPLRAVVVDAHDKGGIVLNIGGAVVALDHQAIDAADVRPPSYRPLTDEEEDRAEMAAEALQAGVAAGTPGLDSREEIAARQRKMDAGPAKIIIEEKPASPSVVLDGLLRPAADTTERHPIEDW